MIKYSFTFDELLSLCNAYNKAKNTSEECDVLDYQLLSLVLMIKDIEDENKNYKELVE